MSENFINRILYIEDSEALCKLFKTVIEQRGFQVDVAYNGKDGMAKFAEKSYGIVAVDYLLPDMTGLDIIRLMLADNPYQLIIMITGEGSEEIAAEALSSGVANYFIKHNKKLLI